MTGTSLDTTTSLPPLPNAVADERWEDTHIEDFQAFPARLLPKRLSAETVARLHELGKEVENRQGEEGVPKRQGSATHWKYYLQGNEWVQTVAPELVAELRGVMEEADRATWKFLEKEENVYVRLLEYHTYIEGGDLMEGFELHYDGGSILTMVMMLSKPGEDFEGGELVASDQKWGVDGCESFVSAGIRNVGDCVVFPSHKYHNVHKVTSGKRHVAVMELWNEYPGVKDGRPGYPLILRPNEEDSD